MSNEEIQSIDQLLKQIEEETKKELEEKVFEKVSEESGKEEVPEKPEEFPEVEVVEEKLHPEVQKYKDELIKYEELSAEFPDKILEYLKSEKSKLSKRDPYYKEKSKILKERIELVKAEMKEKKKVVRKKIKPGAVPEVIVPEEEFPEVEIVEEKLHPEVQKYKDELIKYEESLGQPDEILKYLEKKRFELFERDPYYKEKLDVLEKRIELVKAELLQRYKDGWIEYEKSLAGRPEVVLISLENEKLYLLKSKEEGEEPLFDEKWKILEERIAVVKEELEKKKREEIAAAEALKRKAEEEEKNKYAKEILEWIKLEIEPYTKENLKARGIKIEDPEALWRFALEEAEKLILKRKEEEEEKKELLKKLDEARKKLINLEKKKQEFEGLVGAFKGFLKSFEKASVFDEYKKALDNYREVRAQYVGDNIRKFTEEKSRLADERAVELYRGRSRLYKFWKKLGELNLELAYKKITKREIQSKVLRFAARMVSVRAGISAGLLGLGVWAGVGTAAGMGLFLTRRGFSGIGSAVGSYDLLKMGTEKWATTKGWRAELTKEEIEKMSLSEIEERMAHFELNAPLSGKKVSENETYLKLQERYQKLKEEEIKNSAEKTTTNLKNLMAEADEKLEKLARQSKRNERIIKGIAVGVGLVAGSGALSKLISGKWGWEQFSRVGAVESETALKAPREVPLEAAQNQLRLSEEFVSRMAGPDHVLTGNEIASLKGLEKYLADLGLEPSDSKVIKGLGIASIDDIARVENRLEDLSKITSDPEILKTIVEKGLSSGDAENLKGLLDQLGKMPVALSPELEKDFLKAVILNNFEHQQDFINILSKCDIEHLKIAGILKDGKLDLERFREIVNVDTIEIDRKGKTLYQALKEYYTKPIEKGGLGLSGREARAKIFEQFHNDALLKNGKLQDLVEVGDQIKIDKKGNVLLYIAEDGEMARRKDILSIVGDNDIKSGKQVFEIKEGIKVRAIENPLDGHTVIKITDAEGITHRISDYSWGKTAYVDGKKVILEDWLREKDLLDRSHEWVPEKVEDLKEWPKELSELEQFKETQRYFMEEQREFLAELGKQRDYALRLGNEELANEISKKIESVQDALGEMKRVTLPEEVAAKHEGLNRILRQFDVPPVEDFSEMSKPELNHYVEKIKNVLENTPPDKLNNLEEKVRQHLATVHDYGKKLSTGEISKEEVIPKDQMIELPEITGAAMVKKVIDFPDAKIYFGYDEVGNVVGYKTHAYISYEVPYLHGYEPEKYLKEDFYSVLLKRCEETGKDFGLSLTDVKLEARTVGLEDWIHHQLLEKGMYAEDDFIRKSIVERIESMEKEYGDIFK